MVKFGDKLREEEHPEWREGYIDYEGLKTSIDDLAQLKDDRTASPTVLTAKQHIFQGFLDREIEKVSCPGNLIMWGAPSALRGHMLANWTWQPGAPAPAEHFHAWPKATCMGAACMWPILSHTVSTLQVLAFYKGKLAEVQGRAASLAVQDGGSGSAAQADEQTDALRDLAADITHLLQYISLNLAGVEAGPHALAR